MSTNKAPETQDSTFQRVVDYFLKTEKPEGDKGKTNRPKRIAGARKKPTKAKKR